MFFLFLWPPPLFPPLNLHSPSSFILPFSLTWSFPLKLFFFFSSPLILAFLSHKLFPNPPTPSPSSHLYFCLTSASSHLPLLFLLFLSACWFPLINSLFSPSFSPSFLFTYPSEFNSTILLPRSTFFFFSLSLTPLSCCLSSHTLHLNLWINHPSPLCHHSKGQALMQAIHSTLFLPPCSPSLS